MKKILFGIIVFLTPLLLFAQQTVTGIVEDENGEPLPGVNVVIKGTFTGATTDASGSFNLMAKEGDILEFSFLGYKTLEVPYTGQSEINVTLEPDLIGVDEVVVIGYGTTTKKEVTGSVTSVKPAEMVKGNVRSPIGGLQGVVAGLSILRSNGSDPNSEYTIRLRGLNSFSGGKSPLILVDGVVWTQSLDIINPEMIESIDVLKDGSAAAIYGTRATNGVILISLKEPEKGTARYEISANTSIEKMQKDTRWFTADEYRDFIAVEAPDRIATFDRGSSTDWQKEVFRTAIDQNHSITVSGSTEKIEYLANIFLKNDQGTIPRNSSTVVTPSLFVSQTGLNDRLKIDYQLMYSRVDRTYANTDAYSGVVAATLVRNPTEPIYDAENVAGGGYYNKYVSAGTNQIYANPIAIINERTSDVKNNFVKGSIIAAFNITSDLKVNFTGSYNYFQSNSGTYYTRYYPQLGRDGEASYSLYENYNYTLEPSLEYKNTFLRDHDIQLLAGYSYYDNVFFSMSAGNYNFDTDNFLWNNIGSGAALNAGTATMSSNKQSNRLIAFFGRALYNYKTKYLLSASLRYEGSSRFGKNNKWGLFPAVSVGWRLNEEEFIKNLGWIDNLKLRAGVGVTGNQDIPNYQSIIRMSVGSKFLYNGEWLNSFQSASNPNPDLKWEKKTEYNIGLDLTIFKKFSAIIDLYSRTTSDMLWYYTVPVPPNVSNYIYANVGSIRNRGIEVQLSADAVSTTKFNWITSVNFALNRNKCVSLSDPSRGYELPYLKITPAACNWTQIIKEGEPVGDFWAPIYIGADVNGEAVYEDVDGDGTISPENDRRKIGHDYPNFELGWSNQIRIGNFDIAFFFRGLFGQSLINFDRVAFENWGPFNAGANVLKSIEDRPDYRSVAYVWDSRYLEESTFVKLDNVTLGYNFKIGLTNFRFTASGNNLLTFTNYSGNDPEIPVPDFNTSIGSMGWNNLTYPYSRIYTLGLKINF